MKTVRFLTLGCKLNFAESSELGKQLLAHGFVRAQPGEPATVCVVNTCSVTDAADHKGRQAIHRIRRENPDALLVVTGCYAQLKPQEVADIEGVDLVLGQQEKFSLVDFIQRLEHHEADKINNTRTVDLRRFFPSASSDDRTRHFLKVQDGCDYYCTYCTIPMARGRSRNATIGSVVEAAEDIVRQGGREIVITGVNIGDFGRTTGETFIDLLRSLDEVQAPEGLRYRISSCEPNLLTEEIIRFVAASRHFAPHFHIPLQSGSDDVLRIMHRRYDRALFASRVQTIRQLMPHAFIGVDVMVGVRGETDMMFDDSRSFISGLDVSQLHVFTYSERAGTRMLDVQPVIPQRERQRRSRSMHALSEQKLQAFYAAQRGRTATVLWEARRQAGQMSGFTENYVRVSAPYDSSKVNCFERITI